MTVKDPRSNSYMILVAQLDGDGGGRERCVRVEGVAGRSRLEDGRVEMDGGGELVAVLVHVNEFDNGGGLPGRRLRWRRVVAARVVLAGHRSVRKLALGRAQLHDAVQECVQQRSVKEGVRCADPQDRDEL